MTVIKWNEALASGNELIDEQHKVLISILNAIEYKVNVNQVSSIAQEDVTELSKYIDYHFDFEIQLFRDLGCSESSIDTHRLIHDNLKKQVDSHVSKSSLEPEEFLHFLWDWLFGHIINEDISMITPNKNKEVILSMQNEAFTEASNRFKLLTDNLPASVWIQDLSGDLSYVNLRWLTQMNLSGIPGKSDWFNSIHEDDREAYIFGIDQVKKTLQSATIIYRVDHLNTTFWVKEEIVPRPASDSELIGLMGVGIDITEQMKATNLEKNLNAELELRVKQRTHALVENNEKLREAAIIFKRQKEKQIELNRKLEEAKEQLVQSEKLAAIGHLAAGVAHEINNPVGYVSSNLNTLGEYVRDLLTLVDSYNDIQEKLDPIELVKINDIKEKIDIDYIKSDVAELLSESKSGLDKVQKIVSDLKDFARTESGKFEPTNINDCLDSTISIAWNEIKYKATLDKQYGELPLILCEPHLISQVFLNLLVNAAQALESSGNIIIKTELEDENILIQIADNGIGMSESTKQKIFNPFFTTKPVGQGTGLGLSVSIGIIEKHNGSLTVESIEGEGTTFSIRLPLNVKNPEIDKLVTNGTL